jgi:hypothetical protein
MVPPQLEREAQLFTRYLVSRPVDPAIAARYAVACERHRLTGAGDPVLAACLRFPALIGFLDAGCALHRPQHPLRRKLFVLTAILETTPDHADRFLPRGFGAGGWLALAGAAAAAALKAAVGLWLLRRLERRA